MEGQKTKFTWKIPNFSRLTVKKMSSDTFIAGDCKWRLLVFPKGNSVDYLSLYLEVADSTDLPDGWNRDAKFSLAVINPFSNMTTVRRESRHVFNAKEKDWGFTSFIPLSKLKNPADRYLVKGTLIVEGEVQVLSAVHCSKVDNKTELNELKPKAPVEASANQTPLTLKPVVDNDAKVVAPSPVADAPLKSEPLNQTKDGIEPTAIASAEEVKKPTLALPPPVIDGTKVLPKDTASEAVQSSANVQKICKGLITQISNRNKPLKAVPTEEILVPSQAPECTPDIQQQQKEALQGFFNMSVEALQQANCFVNIEGILQTLVQHTNNLQEKTILEDIISRLAEFKESITNAKAAVESAQARRTSLAGKTAGLDSKLEQRKKELGSLESEFSTLSEEEAKLEAEIKRLTAQKEEIVRQKKSVSIALDRANQETNAEIEEWRNLEREIKQTNAEWLRGKEKLASANVRWKLFREDLGFGKLNIS